MTLPPPDHTRAIPVEGPLDLASSLFIGYGAGDPSTRRTPLGMWHATRTDDGPATMLARVSGSDVHILTWGPGARALAERAPALIGLDDDPGALVPACDRVRAMQRKLPGLRLGRGRTVSSVLYPTIIGQRVTGAEAKGSWRQLVAAQGDPAPGPGPVRLLPTAASLRRVPEWAFHRFGLESGRAKIILRIAWAADQIDEAASRMPSPELFKWLQKIPGIGPWTAAIAVAAAHGWADAVPLGDYNLPRLIGHALADERDADDARMLQLLAPYREAGQRWRVIKLAKFAGSKPERRGARMPTWKTEVALASKRDAARTQRRKERGGR